MREYYVPGLGEKDTDKIIRSLMQAHENSAMDADNIAALTGSKITSSLGADVLLNNIATYFDGPSVAQGSTGTWFVSGSVTVSDTAGVASIYGKLWDGTTVIASGYATTGGANFGAVLSFSGVITSPAGNLRISCKDTSATSGKILSNVTGAGKDSTITAHRIA